MNQKTLILIIVALVVVAGIIWFIADRPETDTDGIGQDVEEQGRILAIDRDDQILLLHQATVVNDETGELAEKTFAVHWDENTQFFLFENPSQVAEDRPSSVDASELVRDKNAVIKGTLTSQNTIQAEAVTMLLGTARAEVVE